MNQKLWSGIAKAAVLTVVGTTLSVVGSSNYKVAASPENNSVTVERVANTAVADTSPLKRSELPLKQVLVTDISLSDTPPTTQESAIATIYPHQWEEKSAVTLRVRNIPVLTFLASETVANDANGTKTSDSESVKQSENVVSDGDPLVRAKAVAAEIDRLSQENFDAQKITVSWDEPTKSYSIKAGDRLLASINETTILPDTTKDLAADALQATNRLRRLLGDAQPLQEIAGLPAPQPTAALSETQMVKGGVKGGQGMASWYGPGFHGRQTANGERFNQNALTAAHRSLPFGTKVRVTNVNNGRSVVVRINDRGPFAKGRVIDLSAGAAAVIGLTHSGVAPVRLEILGR